MTTVVITPTEIAHDARGTSSGMIMSDSFGKSMAFNGDVYVGIGSSTAFVYLMHLLIKGKPHPRWTPKTGGFVVVSRHSGELEALSLILNEKNQYSIDVSPLLVVPFAFGSGGNWAISALDSGKNAREAIEYAMERDNCSGGEITVIPRYRETPIADYNLDWLNGKPLKTLSLIGEEITDIVPEEGVVGVSMESLSADIQAEINPLFKYSELVRGETVYLNRIAGWITNLTNTEEGPFGVFSLLKERWAFGVEGKVADLSRFGNKRQYADLTTVHFYCPPGLKVLYLTYLDQLERSIALVEGIEDSIKKMDRHILSCVGNIDNLLKANSVYDQFGVPDHVTIRNLLGECIDTELTNNRCLIDRLVERNGDWSVVEKRFNALVKRFYRMPIKALPDIAKKLSDNVLRLADELEHAGEIKSTIGSDNFKKCLIELEKIALAVDAVGTIGYLMQQLETSLIQNAELLKKM